MNIEGRIEEYIAREELLSPNAPVIVGLSGGADSVALLSILLHLGYECIACHCNFMLRGEESVRDRDHALDTARRLGVVFEETTFDTTGYAHKKGISIEMAARELRYEWFEAMRRQHNAQAIAVAHHRDDNAETILLNLVRGTGLAGVTGMSARNGYIVRPLLCLSREELTTYLAQRQLGYATDSTNLESLYARNKIRLEVMPVLRQINPSADICLERSIAHLRESEKFYRTAIEEWSNRVCRNDGEMLYIDLDLLHTSPAPATLLFELLSPMGFNASQIEAMASEGQMSGRQFMSTTHRAVSHRNNLVVHPLRSLEKNVIATWQLNEVACRHQLSTSYHNIENYEIPRNKNIACFDADRIQFPLILRHWQQGDTFVPFGMRGRKKVSDYFTDLKFSLVEKEEALLLCDSEKILWIAGHRASNEARITQHTSRILQVEYIVK